MENDLKNYLTKEELKIYNRICSYTKPIDSNQLNNFENSIFGKLTQKQRLEMEYNRLKDELKRNPNTYAEYLNDMLQLEKLIKILDFDPTVNDEISKKIIAIQIEIEQPIRLLSVLNKMKKNLEYEAFKRVEEQKKVIIK